jgi:biotin transport system substrate-specific component
MAALTALGAFLRIPLPYVPLTLQLTFVCLAGLWLGPGRGALSQGVYLTAGLIGFPIFARGGGLHYALEPTFGYLLGFVPAAFAVGWLTRSAPSYGRCLLAVYAGLACTYLPGALYLHFILNQVLGQPTSMETTLKLGLASLPKDLALGPLVAYLGRQVRSRLGLF